MSNISGWLPNLLGPASFQVDGVESGVQRRETINLIGATVEDDSANERTNITLGDVSFTTTNGDVVQSSAQLDTTDATPTTIGTTFALATDTVYVVDVQVESVLAGAGKAKIFNERRVLKNDAGTVTAAAQETMSGPTELGGSLASSVAIAYTGTTGRVEVTGVASTDIRWKCNLQIASLTAAEGAVITEFDPSTITGLTFDLDIRDATAGGGVITAIPGATITGGEEPGYVASDADYANLPVWEILRVTAQAIRLTSGQHGFTTGPYSLAFVGECGDSWLLAEPGGNVNITGSGGSGDKYQMTGDAATWLADSSGSAASVPGVIVFVFDGASSKIYKSRLTATSGDSGTTPSLAATNVVIGNYSTPSSSLGMNGRGARLVGWDKALSNTEAGDILNGFGTLYGISIGA